MTAQQIGNRVFKLRTQAKLSQRQLAENVMALGHDRVKITHAYLSRIESGERRASVPVLRALAQALGTTEVYLEEGAAWWTVAALYVDTTDETQPIIEWVKAKTADDAGLLVTAKLATALGGEPLRIAGVFPGRISSAL